MARPRKDCYVCGASRAEDSEAFRACIGATTRPVCRRCEGFEGRLLILLEKVREVTRTNAKALNSLHGKISKRWPREELGACPSYSTVAGAAVFLAICGERNAWTLDGLRGGRGVVVTRLDRAEVSAYRFRLMGKKSKVSSWETGLSRLVELMRVHGPKALQVEADKVLAHGAVDVETGGGGS